MKDLHTLAMERIAPVKNMYDIIRIIDPVNNHLLIIKDSEIIDTDGTCYEYWEKGMICSNCISMKACDEMDTFVKIEHAGKRVVLVIATPLFINGDFYITEMLKELSKDGTVFTETDIGAIIDETNERIIRDEPQAPDTKARRKPEAQEYIKADTDKLQILNKRIQELRDVLNEMCITSTGSSGDKEKLRVSQYLDELIVEYMRSI